MRLLTRYEGGGRILTPGRVIGLCTGMIVIPALLFGTAARFPSAGGGEETALGDIVLDEPLAPLTPPLSAVAAGTVEVVENAKLVRPRAVAAIPASSPAVPVPALVAPPPPPPKPPPVRETGVATWYDTFEGTCAHVTLPMGTVVTVTNLLTGVSTTCRVADRGPFLDGRVIDLDTDIFAQLAPPDAGVMVVQLRW